MPKCFVPIGRQFGISRNIVEKTCFKLVFYLEKNKIKLFEDDDDDGNMTVVKCELLRTKRRKLKQKRPQGET